MKAMASVIHDRDRSLFSRIRQSPRSLGFTLTVAAGAGALSIRKLIWRALLCIPATTNPRGGFVRGTLGIRPSVPRERYARHHVGRTCVVNGSVLGMLCNLRRDFRMFYESRPGASLRPLVSSFRNRFTTLRTIAPKNAGTNPWILKPGTKTEASFNINAFITNQKTPSEMSVSGNVTIFRNRPTVAFTNPIAIAAMRAAPKPVMSKPRMT